MKATTSRHQTGKSIEVMMPSGRGRTYRQHVRWWPLDISLHIEKVTSLHVEIVHLQTVGSRQVFMGSLPSHKPARPVAAGYANCPTPIEEQLEPFAALDDKWYDKAGYRYEPAGLEWVAKLLNSIAAQFSLPTPYMYPTPQGLVRAEWSSDEWEVLVTLDIPNRSALAIASNVVSDLTDELPVIFSNGDAEMYFGQFLAKYVNGTN